MSKTGFKGISLRDDDVEQLLKIGSDRLEPMAINPTPAAVIRFLIKYYSDAQDEL